MTQCSIEIGRVIERRLYKCCKGMLPLALKHVLVLLVVIVSVFLLRKKGLRVFRKQFKIYFLKNAYVIKKIWPFKVALLLLTLVKV